MTVNVPSSRADTLIQYAGPLWTGAGGAPAPGCGAAIGAMGIAAGGWNMPGAPYLAAAAILAVSAMIAWRVTKDAATPHKDAA